MDWLKGVLAFFQALLGLVMEQKGESAGKAKAAAETAKEIDHEITTARKVESAPADPDYDARLSKRFDRSA